MSNNHHLVNLNITFRNTDTSEALKNYAFEKIGNCIKKFVHHNVDAQIVLNVEKTRHIAEVTFHADGHDFKGSESSEDLYASIDKLTGSLGQQLRKHKERLTEHH